MSRSAASSPIQIPNGWVSASTPAISPMPAGTRRVPALDDLTDALQSLPAGTFVIVEQHLYPCDFDRPYPIAARTRKTLQAAGIG